MARYTIQLRHLIDLVGEDEVKSWFTNYELSDYLTSAEIAVINERGTWSKDKLAQLIIDHYYIYEIGFETPALFRHQAKVAMQEIMEEKLPLIYSAAIEYDPLVNVDYTETFNRTSNNENNTNTSSNSTSSTNSSSDSSGLSVNSDTPQKQISKADILAGTYATSTGANETETSVEDETTATNSGNSTSTDNGTEAYTKTIRGNSGVSATAQKMVEQYRQNIIMINRDIIENISSLFMTIF